MFRVAIDTGGTFTDLVTVDETGQTVMIKIPTNREDPARGVMEGLAEMAGRWGMDLERFLDHTEQIIHGTTLTLNALLEGRGARTALLTTEGFRDALEMRRSRRAEQWDLRAPVPSVLVPRRLRMGVRERLDYRGEVITPLDEARLEEAALAFREQGVEAVAICFLFSFLNPDHEERAAAVLRGLLPGVFVAASSATAPRIREYERTSTTVLNAYLTPVMAGYLDTLEAELQRYGWQRPFNLTLNSGGLADTLTVRNNAVQTLLSGPAGGARGGQSLSAALDRPSLVVADMGGTSFDVVLVVEGECRTAPEAEINGYPVSLPLIDIKSVGAGGGSIAFVDSSGRLHVGPRSAGSFPGPACYGRGGSEPAVTDAALVLGLLNPDTFLDGKLKLDSLKASQAVTEYLAGPLGLEVREAALAVYRVAAARMADAVRLVTVQQGLDPRDFTLVAAGGAFPLFAGAIAAELGIAEVIIPLQGPAFCAWGMLGATCRHDVVRTCLMTGEAWDAGRLNTTTAEMLKTGNEQLDRLGVSENDREAELILEMKYAGQHHEISIVPEITDFTFSSPEPVDEAFHRRHRELYGYEEPGKPWEIVNLRLVCRQKTRPVFLPEEPATDNCLPAGDCLQGDDCLQGGRLPAENGSPTFEREVFLDTDGPAGVRVFNHQTLPRQVRGPALIEYPYTTVLVPEGFAAHRNRRGYISLCREEDK